MSKVTFVKGNIFDSKMSALVCPVNCVGVMGAGLAKAFRDGFINTTYKEACLRGEMAPGSVLVRQPLHIWSDTPKTLIYVATKQDWRDDSKLEWVETGLINLMRAMNYYNIPSVALPALGCGCGALPWPSVEMSIKSIFENDGQTKEIEVYLPL